MQAFFKQFLFQSLMASVALAGVVLTLVWSAHHHPVEASHDDAGPVVVVLSASWCAKCREVVPIAQKIVNSEPRLGIRILDVDGAGAHEEAKQYSISIRGSDIPEVYLVTKGKSTLLFTGKGHQFGQGKQAEEKIRARLTPLL